MEFRILGPLEVVDGERSISLGGPKQRSVLALLLLARGRAVSTDTLVERIWDGDPRKRLGRVSRVMSEAFARRWAGASRRSSVGMHFRRGRRSSTSRSSRICENQRR